MGVLNSKLNGSQSTIYKSRNLMGVLNELKELKACMVSTKVEI